MHPRGFGIPPIRAASFAGPFGKSPYSSLMGTPDCLPSERIDGACPVSRKVVRFMRRRYLETGTAPSIRTLGKESGVPIKELYQLFPKGPAKKAARIAGLPKPKGCI